MRTSEYVLHFLDEIEPLNLHGFEIRQGGQCIAQAGAAPFRNDQPHRMYSVSKSVVSLAVGILAGEGKLRLDERIMPYFEDYVPDEVPEELGILTVRDLLRMASCYDVTQYRPLVDENWTKAFFTGTPQHPAGTIFTYDTGASQVLASLVERLSGQPLLDFVRSRLFEPIGMKGPFKWLTDRAGNPQGGTGLIMPLHDLALLSEFCMGDGLGLLDRDYLRAATGCQIMTDHRSMPEEKYGYGYYFWQMRRGFCMYGMGGQMGLCLPEKNLVLATTGDLILSGTGVQPIYDAFFRCLSGMNADGSVMDDPEMEKRLSRFYYRPLSGKRPERHLYIELKTPIDPVKAVEISADGLCLVTDTARYPISCGPDAWTENEFRPIGPCIASSAMAAEGEYRAHIELTGDTSCAIRISVSFRQDDEAAVRIQSSTWECVTGYSGTAQGTCREIQ